MPLEHLRVGARNAQILIYLFFFNINLKDDKNPMKKDRKEPIFPP